MSDDKETKLSAYELGIGVKIPTADENLAKMRKFRLDIYTPILQFEHELKLTRDYNMPMSISLDKQIEYKESLKIVKQKLVEARMWAGKAMGAMQKDLPDFCKNDNPEKDLEHYLPKE